MKGEKYLPRMKECQAALEAEGAERKDWFAREERAKKEFTVRISLTYSSPTLPLTLHLTRTLTLTLIRQSLTFL